MKYFDTQKKILAGIMISVGILITITVISARTILNFPVAMIVTVPSIIALLITTPFLINKIDK